MAKKVIIDLEVNTEEAKQGIDDVSSAVDEFGGNVGGAFGKLGSMFQSLKKGLGGLSLGFKGLKGAIASTGIGLLVIALGSLVAYFTQTQKGIELIERGMAALTTTINVIVDRFSALGEALLAFDFDGVKDSFKGVTEEIVEEVKAVDALVVSMQKLAYEQSQFIVDSERLRTEFEEQKKRSDDVTLSFEERIDAAQKAAEAQEKLLTESQRLLKEETIALLIKH